MATRSQKMKRSPLNPTSSGSPRIITSRKEIYKTTGTPKLQSQLEQPPLDPAGGRQQGRRQPIPTGTKRKELKLSVEPAGKHTNMVIEKTSSLTRSITITEDKVMGTANQGTSKHNDPVKTNKATSALTKASVPTKNSFEVLSDLDNEDSENEDESSKNGSQAEENSEEAAPDEVVPVKVSRAHKPPPLILRGLTNFLALATKLQKTCVQGVEFVTRYNTTKLVVKDATDYRAAVALLTKEGVEYHTFVLEGERQTKLIVKGIDASVDPDYIKEALLEEHGIEVELDTSKSCS